MQLRRGAADHEVSFPELPARLDHHSAAPSGACGAAAPLDFETVHVDGAQGTQPRQCLDRRLKRPQQAEYRVWGEIREQVEPPPYGAAEPGALEQHPQLPGAETVFAGGAV